MPTNRIEVEVGVKLFEFADRADWSQNATARYTKFRRHAENVLQVAADGRVLFSLKGFMEAEQRNAFPVSVYAIDY